MIGDVEGMSRSHSNLGAILLNIGEWDRALPHLKQSLELKQRIGDAKQFALAETTWVTIHLFKGDLPQADGLFETRAPPSRKNSRPECHVPGTQLTGTGRDARRQL